MPPSQTLPAVASFDASVRTYDPKIARDIKAVHDRIDALTERVAKLEEGPATATLESTSDAGLLERVEALETANAKLVADLGGHTVPTAPTGVTK